MRSRLYKLAVWYIGRCNAKWNQNNKHEFKALDRLTYRHADKAYLFYGADAEWRHFNGYDALDNAIQKLADFEDREYKNNAQTTFN